MPKQAFIDGIREVVPEAMKSLVQESVLLPFIAEAECELVLRHARPRELSVTLGAGNSAAGGVGDAEIEGVTFDGSPLSFMPYEAFLAVSRANQDGPTVCDDCTGENATLVGTGRPRIYSLFAGTVYVHPAPESSGTVRYRQRGVPEGDPERPVAKYEEALRHYVLSRLFDVASFMALQRCEGILAYSPNGVLE